MHTKTHISITRKALYRIAFFFIAVTLALFAGGNFPSAKAQGNGATVSISADGISFGAAEAVTLHVTLTNPNGYSIGVLKWLTPAVGMERPLFTILRDGEPVNYLGMLVKRIPPTEQDYITLRAGESLTYDVNVANYYDLSVSGNYAFEYSVASTEMYAGQDNKAGSLISNTLELFIDGHPAPLREAITPQSVSGTNSFISCSGAEQTSLITARIDASNYAAGATSYFSANMQGARYTTWFGVYDLNRYNTVKNHFNAISSAVDTATPMTFDCTCLAFPDPENYFAYVYPDEPYTVHLCGAFWPAPATGTDLKAGVLIHEISHFDVVAGTDDNAYGQFDSQALAVSNPALAIQNADSHEYFAENTPPIAELDSYEPDNTSGQAQLINSGTSQTHSIVPATDQDWVRFQLSSQSAILLETTGSTSSDTVITLYNSGLTELDTSDDEGIGLYSFIDRVCGVDPLPAGTYYLKVIEFESNNEIPAYNISFSAKTCPAASVNVNIAGERQGSYLLAASESARVNYAGVDSGPVKVENINAIPIIAAIRDAWAVNGVTTSFAQLMGLPLSQVSDRYLFPAYNNVTLNEQLRIGNVDTVASTVTVTIGGVLQGTYVLDPSEAVRVNYAGLDSGPVIVDGTNGVDIIAAIREAWAVNGVTKSFVQLMGLPATQLSDKYVFPAYNNVTLNEQLRIANVDMVQTTVNVTIGGVLQGTYTLYPPGSLLGPSAVRVNYAGLDSGPVIVDGTDGVDIIAAIRDAWAVNGVTTSFAQLMGLPASQLSDQYLFPAYNNVTLNDQLRIGNVDTVPSTVTVTIGGVLQGTYTLQANEAVRVNYAGLDSGPVVVDGTNGVDIIAAIREAWSVNGVTQSFVQLMGLPAGQLSTTFLFPAYNNVTLNEQLRFGVP